MSKKHLHSIHVEHYKNTAGSQGQVMPIPEVVKISMSQNIGAPCTPLVAKGDKVKVGQLLGDVDAFVSCPVYSSVSGEVTAIEQKRNPMGGMDTFIVIKTDGNQEVCEGIKKPEKPKDLAEFVKEVRKSGVVGLGGASFPTHIKLNPKNIDDVHTLIVNAAECEPFITTDHRLMLDEADDLIDGCLLIMEYDGLDVGYIAVEDNKKDAMNHLEEVLNKRGIKNISVFSLPSSYPKGAERVLVYEVTHQVMNAGVLPADMGVILDNATTVASIGKYFRTGMPLVERRVTVDGDAVNNPQNVICPVGTMVSDLVEFCGGYKKEPRKIIQGGPMMGRAVVTDETPTVKATSAVLCFSKDLAEAKEETSCINCGRCHNACPFGLIPTAMADAYQRKDAQALSDLNVMQCMECGSCSFICPAHRPLSFMNKLGKQIVKEAGIK